MLLNEAINFTFKDPTQFEKFSNYFKLLASENLNLSSLQEYLNPLFFHSLTSFLYEIISLLNCPCQSSSNDNLSSSSSTYAKNLTIEKINTLRRNIPELLEFFNQSEYFKFLEIISNDGSEHEKR